MSVVEQCYAFHEGAEAAWIWHIRLSYQFCITEEIVFKENGCGSP